MTQFKCFLCHKYFSDETNIVKHLKINHNIKDRTINLKCAVNSDCKEVYTTFKCFKNHILKCKPKQVCIWFRYTFQMIGNYLLLIIVIG